MFESLYCTWSRICCGQHPTNSPTILAPCRNSLSDFNELCWSSLHHYTSLLRRQRSPGKSIVLSFLSCRCESTSVKSPSMHLCHLPFGSVTSLPHTPSETTSKKLNKLQGGLRCVGGILPFCFWPFRKKKKKVWKILLPRIPPAAPLFSRITFFQFGVSPAVRISEGTGWTIICHHVVAQQMWQDSRGGDISHLVFKTRVCVQHEGEHRGFTDLLFWRSENISNISHKMKCKADLPAHTWIFIHTFWVDICSFKVESHLAFSFLF